MTSLYLCPVSVISALYFVLPTIKARYDVICLFLSTRRRPCKDGKLWQQGREEEFSKSGVSAHVSIPQLLWRDVGVGCVCWGGGGGLQTAPRCDCHNNRSRWMLCWGSVEAMIGLFFKGNPPTSHTHMPSNTPPALHLNSPD